MRRSITAWLTLVAVLVTLAVSAPAVYAAAPGTGSTAADGAEDAAQRITLADLVLAARCMTGQATLTPEQMDKLDADGSGQITLSDLVRLARLYVDQSGVPAPAEPTPATTGAPSPSSAPEPDETEEPSAVPEPIHTPTAEPTASATATAPPTAAPLPTANPSRNVLVVYFSATGNTRQAAEYVADAAGADLVLALEPTDPYTSRDLNWRDPTSRVYREYDNPELRDIPLVVDTVENWDAYDTVFVGYPIWWGNAAWPVNGFLRANDFTGKTVVPFCTSASSGVGQSAEQLATLAGTGTWLPGQRFSAAPSRDTVSAWVAGLHLAD